MNNVWSGCENGREHWLKEALIVEVAWEFDNWPSKKFLGGITRELVSSP
jgi:hypothetical protein